MCACLQIPFHRAVHDFTNVRDNRQHAHQMLLKTNQVSNSYMVNVEVKERNMLESRFLVEDPVYFGIYYQHLL